MGGGNVEAAVAAAKKAAENQKPLKYEEGVVVKFSNVTEPTIRREDIKSFLLEKEAAVEYISFESGKSDGLVLLNLEHGKKSSEVLGGEKYTQNIKGNEITFEAAGEKEFDELAAEFSAFKKKMDLLKVQGGKKGFKGRKGGRGQGKFKGKSVNRNEEDGAKNTRKRFADSDDEGATKEKVAKAAE